ncbi:MAG: HD-GYP domain-containing protein [Anaerolineae bacterium]|jgi:putative nucleotidyltransferase with HDIG domain|nr:HD-GYP domain-containing protein [Anaerolineae bacterium]MBT7070278.1 HD-GYP domain-containing protein [Anaerolineae bacterium]MBT7325481.1 HD-GYP domain-containing protein [Anaerolineae bacterium]
MTEPSPLHEPQPCCLHSNLINILSFLAGAVVLVFFSTLQKILVGETHVIFQPRGYLIPVLYGGFTGMMLGQWYRRIKKNQAELLHAYNETLVGWAKAIEFRDKSTEDHTQRVVLLAEELACAMKFPEQDMVHLRRGALLHDIGKIAIPDAILGKPETLTPEERAIIEQHPERARQMLETIDFLSPALCIPCCHHERWDGSGYPHGYKGEETPLMARIFAVADVWDALTSDRPYRKAWLPEDALAHIENNAGKLFDPDVVQAFSNHIRPHLGYRK